MISFRKFIAESGDSSYEFHKNSDTSGPHWGDETHKYHFVDGVGNKKHVVITHHSYK